MSTDAQTSQCIQFPSRSLGRVWLAVFLLCVQLPAQAQEFELGGRNEFLNLVFDPVLLDDPATASPPTSAGDSDATNAQAASPGAGERVNSMADYQARIQATLQEEGLYSENLRQQYQSLGLIQQEVGRHEEAVATFEQAMHIARVNDGLFTLRQIDTVKRIIDSLEVLGNREREKEYRGYLYYIQQKSYNPGDPALVAAREAWADWNIQNYMRNYMLEPYEILLPGRSDPDEFVLIQDTLSGDISFLERNIVNTGATHAMPLDLVLDARLREARDLYNRNIDEDTSQLDQAALERARLRVVATEYALRTHVQMMLGGLNSVAGRIRTNDINDITDISRSYRRGAEVLETIIADYRAAPDRDPRALARAWRNLGDFQIAYNYRHRAVSAYTQMWSQLAALDPAAGEREALLGDMPFQPVPAFAVQPYSRAFIGLDEDEPLEYRGYIDVRFSISSYGDLRGVDVEQTSEDTPYEVRRKLVDYLRFVKSRPGIDGGDTIDVDSRLYRFYYSY